MEEPPPPRPLGRRQGRAGRRADPPPAPVAAAVGAVLVVCRRGGHVREHLLLRLRWALRRRRLWSGVLVMPHRHGLHRLRLHVRLRRRPDVERRLLWLRLDPLAAHALRRRHRRRLRLLCRLPAPADGVVHLRQGARQGRRRRDADDAPRVRAALQLQELARPRRHVPGAGLLPQPLPPRLEPHRVRRARRRQRPVQRRRRPLKRAAAARCDSVDARPRSAR
mmetsp:Transcript_26592/g.70976  ORF Transcript_26592/g.70976 Transcript_26592/m.70976 type:complete len:222 (-) Transcript_26592:414-1079(-)